MKRLDYFLFQIPKCLYLAAGIMSLPLLMTVTSPNAVASEDVPLMEQGIQFGDLAPGRAIVWSRSDRPARMMVE